MNYVDYVREFEKAAAGLELQRYGSVHENGRDYPLLRVDVPGERLLVITAGFHGEEPAGPLTMREHLREVVAYARASNVALRIYPCINPSGFEAGTRYNASGEKPNNDFLRYELTDGSLHGELQDGQTFVHYSLYRESPKETRAILEELEKHPTPLGALDIHQDRYIPGAWTYAYVFGDRTPYRKLMKHSAKHAQLAAKKLVDEQRRTDADGLIEYRDGSVTDYYDRRGARFTATLETTTQMSMDTCHQINLIWIKGFIDLVKSG
ncbi:MAG: M14 family zinc carboxypeptidase [Myxococcaceae bacterium]